MKPKKSRGSEPGPCPLCLSDEAAIQRDMVRHDGPTMARVRCPDCETYEIAADLLTEVEAGGIPRDELLFVTAASLRKAKEGGGPLRIESNSSCWESRRTSEGDRVAETSPGHSAVKERPDGANPKP